MIAYAPQDGCAFFIASNLFTKIRIVVRKTYEKTGY